MAAINGEKQNHDCLEEENKTKEAADQVNTFLTEENKMKDETVTQEKSTNTSFQGVTNTSETEILMNNQNGEDEKTASNKFGRTTQREHQIQCSDGSKSSDDICDKTDEIIRPEDESANEKLSKDYDVIICSAQENSNEEGVGEARSFQNTSVQTDVTPRLPDYLAAEESNFLRFCHLIQKVAPQAVRHRFDQVFPPADLEGIIQQNMTLLKDLYHNRILTRPQWKLICPSGSAPLSSTFDISTMVCLFRNLTNKSPNSGFYDTLPPPSDVSLEADLSRIKYFRNNIAHYLEKDRKIDNNDFPIVWETASMAVSRIGGQIYEQECCSLRTANLDSCYMDIYRQVLIKETDLELKISDLTLSHQQLQSKHEKKISDLTESHQHLQSEHEKEIKQLQIKLEDPVPKHERENINFVTDKWEANKQLFIETSAVTRLIKIMKAENVALVTGSPGTGKTFTVQNVLLSMREEGYDVIPVRSSSDLVRYFSRSARQVFFLDNFCGKHYISNSDIEKWDRNRDTLVDMFTNSSTKCIFICRLQFFLDPKFQNLKIKEFNIINLSGAHRLTLKEKHSIGNIYLDKNIKEHLNDETIINCLCFPLLCSLYDRHGKYTMNTTAYFEKPKQFFETELDELKERPDKTKYGCIVLCVLLNNKVHLDFFSSTNEEGSRMAKVVFEELGVNVPPMKAIKSCFDSMVGSYFRNSNRIGKQNGSFEKIPGYKSIDDYMFDIYCVHVSQTMIETILLYGNSELIRDRALLQSNEEYNENAIVVPAELEHVYFERILKDLSSCRVNNVFGSNQLKYDSHRSKFIKFLTFIDFDVNIKDESGKTPIYEAAEAGYVDVVEMLCEKGANTNLSNENGCTPLIIASEDGHIDVVELLCKKGAVVNICGTFGCTALAAASQEGRIGVVELLCNKGADVNLNDKFGLTPLTAASKGGHIGVVELLCKKGADVNLRSKSGWTPLTEASIRGHTDVVGRLCNKGADVNLRGKFGCTPLSAASLRGFIHIVELLCNEGADVNLRDGFGLTPLTAASLRGLIDEVKLLCDKGADVNLRDRYGWTPLKAASINGHIDVVELLCNKGADVNQSDKFGSVSLIMWCTWFSCMFMFYIFLSFI